MPAASPAARTGSWLALAWLLVLVLPSAWAGPRQIGPSLVWQVRGEWHEVRADLLDAIAQRGMVLSGVSHAADMLARTAAAAGVTRAVYRDAEILHFCKADLSHALVAANPHNLVLCPFQVTIYTLASDPRTVWLGIRVPWEGEPAYRPIDALLRGLIEEVVADYQK